MCPGEDHDQEPNGPYRVEAPEGSIELVNPDGKRYDLTGKPAFSLCRCGASVNKPFCDGTHSKIGFQAAEAAVKKEGRWIAAIASSSPAKGNGFGANRRERRSAQCPLRAVVLVDRLRLPRHVIHQQILPERVGRGEVGFAAAHLRDFLHELH